MHRTWKVLLGLAGGLAWNSAALAQAAQPSSLPAGTAAPPTHLGRWVTDGGKSHVDVIACGPAICANIVWLKEPNDAKGRPLTDGNNDNARLRSRPILGLSLFEGMRPARPAGWSGKIYNPEDGGTFDVKVWLDGANLLKIKGCVLFVCETHTWQRLPPEGPAPATAGAPARKVQ